MKPHKHKDLIIAWANGATVQTWVDHAGKWVDNFHPYWIESDEYRIKPEPKQDVVQFWDMRKDGYSTYLGEPPKHYVPYNLRLIFDGETGKLKHAEAFP